MWSVGDVAIPYWHVVKIVRHMRFEANWVKAGVELKGFVRINNQSIVNLCDLAQPLECKAPVVGKIAPRLLDDGPFMAGKKAADHLLRSIS